ncbi:hypothetical protein Tco_0269122 [Tanacetum coccineum]
MPRRMPKNHREQVQIRQSRSKAIVSKVSTSSSTPGISPDVAELKDMVKALLFDKTNQSQAPATLKAVEESCVTSGGTHSHQNFPATDDNVYRDNIQENNYNQGPISRPPVNQAPAYQAPSYQAPAPQAHSMSKDDFESYIKANDAVMQNMQSQMTNIMDLLTKFVNSNTASTSGSGSLPSNTITNLKGNGKQTRGDKGYGATTPENIQPPGGPKLNDSNGDLFEAPKTKPTLPYPSRANKEKLREKDDLLALKFMRFFRSPFRAKFRETTHTHGPNLHQCFRKLLNNKDKILELTKTQVNENCSAVILKKFPEKLRDPGRFLIPCDFPEMNECIALADLGASINLMPQRPFGKTKSSQL